MSFPLHFRLTNLTLNLGCLTSADREYNHYHFTSVFPVSGLLALFCKNEPERKVKLSKFLKLNKLTSTSDIFDVIKFLVKIIWWYKLYFTNNKNVLELIWDYFFGLKIFSWLILSKFFLWRLTTILFSVLALKSCLFEIMNHFLLKFTYDLFDLCQNNTAWDFLSAKTGNRNAVRQKKTFYQAE